MNANTNSLDEMPDVRSGIRANISKVLKEIEIRERRLKKMLVFTYDEFQSLPQAATGKKKQPYSAAGRRAIRTRPSPPAKPASKLLSGLLAGATQSA